MAKKGENIYLRRDGRYEGRYIKGRGEDGATRFGYVYGKRLSDVRKKLNLLKAEHTELKSAQSSCSFAQFFARYLRDGVRLDAKGSTLALYQSYARLYFLPVLGKYRIDRIQRQQIQAVVEHMHNRALQSATIRNAMRLLASCMRYACEMGWIVLNPCTQINLPQARARKPRVLTREEQRRVLTCIHARDCLAVVLGLTTGMRLGEVCALDWRDVNWVEETITVRASMTYANGESTRSTPKTQAGYRTIPLPELALKCLAQHRAHSDAPQEAYILTGSHTPPQLRTVQRRCARLMDELGLEGVHFHTLRHTFATRCLEQGVDIQTISELLGHQSVKTTLAYYAHSTQEQKREAIRRVELLLRPS